MSETVRVDAPSRSYDVVVGEGLLDELGRRAAAVLDPPADLAFLVTDSHVGPLYAERAEASLAEAGLPCASFCFPAGEASKTWETLGALLQAMAEAGCTRDSVVVALGGGVTGDLAGLAAALFMRGIRVVQAPTSLLAMVDSSVGGKTAVDLPQGKNLVGAFLQPVLVLADVACLLTVPVPLLRDSVGEVVKHGVLASPGLVRELAERPLDAQPLDLGRLERVVAQNVRIKRDVVVADERERGLRQTLNLGHTVGHAIEAASDYALGHGSSVAAGLCVAARGSAALGLADPACAEAVVACVQKAGLPTTCDAPAERLLALARSDKKRHGDTVNVVVPTAIGRCEVVPMPFERFAELVRAGL